MHFLSELHNNRQLCLFIQYIHRITRELCVQTGLFAYKNSWVETMIKYCEISYGIEVKINSSYLDSVINKRPYSSLYQMLWNASLFIKQIRIWWKDSDPYNSGSTGAIWKNEKKTKNWAVTYKCCTYE